MNCGLSDLSDLSEVRNHPRRLFKGEEYDCKFVLVDRGTVQESAQANYTVNISTGYLARTDKFRIVRAIKGKARDAQYYYTKYTHE